MKRGVRLYEDRNFPTLRCLFWITGGITAYSVPALALAYLLGIVTPEGEGVPDWVQLAGLGCLVGPFYFWVCAVQMSDRPKLVADEVGALWHRFLTRFRWDEIDSWCFVIKESGHPEGEDSTSIELLLKGGGTLSLEAAEDFVKAFIDFLPGKQGRTKRCT
ncbi:MAG: hypothetical protein K2W96_26125 [Gemmataceae bacterium]|nr:hypothetical protein [Gemmataceae bacterium]